MVFAVFSLFSTALYFNAEFALISLACFDAYFTNTIRRTWLKSPAVMR